MTTSPDHGDQLDQTTQAATPGADQGPLLPTARVLTIAGSDSGGGAGIQADIKTMLAYGVHAMSVLTSVTAQNSLGVQGVWPLPVDVVEAQYRSVSDDIGVDAVKTGMLGNAETVTAVAKLLAGSPAPVVIDPVCASKHDNRLIDDDGIAALREELFAAATIVTPNLPEAALLAERPAGTDPAELAARLLEYGPQWVLIKGGHAEGDPIDHLFSKASRVWSFPAERNPSPHTHGTGCTLASAIAALLGLQQAAGRTPDVPTTVALAKTYITGAIDAGFPLGAGIGPVDHLWRLRRQLPKM